MPLLKFILRSILWRGIYFISVLGLNIIIARYYEASYSGQIYFISNGLALTVSIGSFSLESGIAYYIAARKMDPVRLANFAILWALAATVMIYLIFKLLLFSAIIPPTFIQYGLAAICYTGGSILVNFFTAIFYAKKIFLLPNILMTLVNLLLIVLVPLSNGILVDRSQYINIYFGGFLAQGALLAICFVWGNKGIWKFIFPSNEALAQIFRYAFQAFVANLVFFLLCRIDYWFVEKYCSAIDLGNYIQVSKLVQMFVVVPAVMASIIFPISAGGDKNAVRQSISLCSRMITAFCALASLVFIATGYWLFPFIYGSTFTNMYIPYLFLIPGIFFLSMLTLLGAHFAGQNKVRLNIVCSVIGLMAIIIGDIILIPIYGIIAAAFVSSAGYFLCLVFLIRIFIQQNQLTFKDMWILKQKDIVGIRTWFLQKQQ